MFGFGGGAALLLLVVFPLLYALVLAVIVACGVVLGNLDTAYLDPYVVRMREAGRRSYLRRNPGAQGDAARETHT